MDNKKLFVCLITGPAGAGKSSVSKALAKKFERSAVIDVDNLRSMIVGGHVRPWPHNQEVETQMSLAAQNACIVANNFIAQGYNVIIDDVIGRKLFNQYTEFFPERKIKIFLLLPSLESLLSRFDNRGADDALRKRTHELHERFASKKDELPWHVIDSSNHTLEETTEEIFSELTK